MTRSRRLVGTHFDQTRPQNPKKKTGPALVPPAAAPVQAQAEEWGEDSPAGPIWALAGKERPERRLPPPASPEIRRPVTSPAQIRRPGGAPYSSHGGAICVLFPLSVWFVLFPPGSTRRRPERRVNETTAVNETPSHLLIDTHILDWVPPSFGIFVELH
jgi:hypothetical protein